MHGLLQAWTCCASGGGELVKDASKDQQGDLCVMVPFRAWQRRLLTAQALCDEVYKDLSQLVFFMACRLGKWSVDHQRVELWIVAIEADAEVNQRMNGVMEAQGKLRVECAFRIGHVARVVRGQCTGDGIFIGEKLVEGCRGHACLCCDGIGCGLVIPETAKDSRGRTEKILQALFATCVALPVWVKDGHTLILAEFENISKNLHPFLEYKYLLA